MVKWLKTAALKDEDLDDQYGKLRTEKLYEEPKEILKLAHAMIAGFEQLFYDFNNPKNKAQGKHLTISNGKLEWFWKGMERLYRERGGDSQFPPLNPFETYTAQP